MLLLDAKGAKDDAFLRIDSAEQAAGDAVLAPFPELEALLATGANRRIGIVIANTQKLAPLEPYFDRLALIVIAFPGSADGRGFSLARKIRRSGFNGALRASGPLVSDQFPQALACGFDEVEIPDANAARQPAQQWLDALGRIDLTYQRDFSAAENILDQRRRARTAGEPKNV